MALNWNTLGLDNEEEKKKKGLNWDILGIESDTNSIKRDTSLEKQLLQAIEKKKLQEEELRNTLQTDETNIEYNKYLMNEEEKNKNLQLEKQLEQNKKDANNRIEELPNQTKPLQNISVQTVNPVNNKSNRSNPIINPNTEIKIANEKDIKNLKPIEQYQVEQNKEKVNNIFSKAGNFIKDTIASIGIAAFSTGGGIRKTIEEGYREREQKLEELKQTKGLSDFEAGVLHVSDTIVDTATDTANGVIGMITSVLNFFDPQKDTPYFTPLTVENVGIPDVSPLQGHEKLGDYESKEDLSNELAYERQQMYLSTGTYNPMANMVGEIGFDVLMAFGLKKVGMKSTGAYTTTGAITTYGKTGNIEDSTKSAISNYLFSKIIDNATIDSIVKQPIAANSSKTINSLFEKVPTLQNSDFAMTVKKVLPELTGETAKVFTGRVAAGEINALVNNEHLSNSEVQKQIFSEAIIWSAINFGLNGYSQIKYEFETIKLSKIETNRQLGEWYKTLGVKETITDQELKSVYRNLAKKFHSDVGR